MERSPTRLADLLRDAITIAESSPADTSLLSHLRCACTSLSELETSPALTVDVLTGTALNGDRPLALSPSETAVLIILGLHGGRLHRDVLASELYGDGDARNAVNSLKVAVHRVRRRVGRADVIRRDHSGYALGRWVKVEMPKALWAAEDRPSRVDSEALSLLRVRLRAGRPAFMLGWPWFDETERRLRDIEHDITVTLAYEALRSRRHHVAIELAEELVREDPLDESGTEIFLRAFMELGNREIADAHYRRYSTRIKGQTGSPPSETLQRIMRASVAASTDAHSASAERTALAH